MFKVNNKNTRMASMTCRFGIFIVNFEHVSPFEHVFTWSCFNFEHVFTCFCRLIKTSKCQPGTHLEINRFVKSMDWFFMWNITHKWMNDPLTLSWRRSLSIETSPLFGFYMITASVIKKVKINANCGFASNTEIFKKLHFLYSLSK